MSHSYTLHPPAASRPGDAAALERAALVQDGFSWGAFLVPSLWFFRHAHLGLGLGAIVAVAGLAVALRALGFGWGTVLAAELLLHGLLGLEGASLRRWALARRGRPVADLVVAADGAEAEAKILSRWLAGRRGGATPPPLPGADRGPRGARPAGPSVLGLFPEPEGRRP